MVFVDVRGWPDIKTDWPTDRLSQDNFDFDRVGQRAVVSSNSNYKLQTHPIVREGTPYSNYKCQDNVQGTERKIGLWSLMEAGHQDRPGD
jgi:hypothetical protein